MTLRLGGDGAITGCTSLEEPTISISGLTMTTPIEAVSGTAAAPSYTFSGDTDNGLYYAGTNSIGLSTAGTNAILIDSSGKVGIGTTPSTKLHVAETGAFSAITASSDVSTTGLASRFALGNSVGTARFTINMKGGGGEEAYLGSEGNFPIYFQTNGAERMRIDSSGNVGIGDTAPSTKFSIKKPIDSSAYGAGTRMIDFKSYFPGYDETGIKASIFSGVDSASPLSTNKGYLAFLINNGSSDTSLDERMRIDSSGKVLINTTTASSYADRLLTVGNTSHTSPTIEIRSATNGFPGLVFSDSTAADVNSYRGAIEYSHSSNHMQIRTNSEVRMLIDSAGNIGFGTASPSASTVEIFQKSLKFSRTLGVTANSTLSLTHASSADHGSLYFDNSASTGGFVFRTNGSSEKVRILGGGGITFNGDTAQVNALDDYEEGSCTITLFVAGTSTTNSATNTVAYYSKVGNIVNVSYYSALLSITNSGNAEINGLPFVAKNVNQHYPPAVFTHTNCFTTDIQNGYMNVNSTNLYPIQRNSTTQAIWNTSGGARYLMFSITYQTN